MDNENLLLVFDKLNADTNEQLRNKDIDAALETINKMKVVLGKLSFYLCNAKKEATESKDKLDTKYIDKFEQMLGDRIGVADGQQNRIATKTDIGRKIYVLFFYFPEDARNQFLYKTWQTINNFAKNYSNIKVLKLLSTDYPTIFQKYNVYSVPVIKVLKNNSEFTFVGDVTAETIAKFLVKSQKGGIALNKSDKLTLNLYHANWCSACKRFMPTWLEMVGQKQAGESIYKNVNLVAIECTNNEKCKANGVPYYPYLTLTNKNNVSMPYDRNLVGKDGIQYGEKNLYSLRKFIDDYCN